MTTLEKIREEIAEIAPLDYPCDKRTPERIRDMALEIVEKYAEQEPTDTWSIKDVADTFKKHGLIREQEPCDDVVSRQAVLDALVDADNWAEEFDSIKALPSVTPKPTECEDVVSRQAVLDYLKANVDDFPDYHEAIEKVLQIPSVRPQEQTGKWIVEVWNNKEHHTCSVCQRVVDYEPCYHYCPYCGARMVEPQERSDKE